MSATSSSIVTRELWTPLTSTWGQAVLLLLITIGAYFQTWVDIWPYWGNKNATYTHGTLVALVAVWLAWRARTVVNQLEPLPSAKAVPLVLVLSAVWVVAERANIFIVYAALWPLLAFAALWAGLGKQAALRLTFPLGFLYFAIPIWDYLKPPLQVITITIADLLTRVFGIPAAFDGPYVTLPTGTILIHEDCSGAHFLCVALAVGVLAGILRRDDLRTRILILAVAGLLSMVFNWLRILLIVLAYLHPDLRDGLETMGHLTFGWWVFALDLVVFGLVLRFVPCTADSDAKIRPPIQTTPKNASNRAGLVMSTIALVTLPASAWALHYFDSYASDRPSAELRLSIAEVNLVAPDLRWQPHYPGVVWEDRFALIMGGGVAVEVYGNQYHEQAQGSELISRSSHLFDPLNFTLHLSSMVYLQNARGESIPAHRDILTDSTGALWLSTYTFLIDGEPIAGIRRAQLTMAFRSIFARTTAGVIAVASPCAGLCETRIADVEETFILAIEGYRGEVGN